MAELQRAILNAHMERAHAILANSSLCSKHLLKTLQLFRYQNEGNM
jgi:hypothetical protein